MQITGPDLPELAGCNATLPARMIAKSLPITERVPEGFFAPNPPFTI